MFTVTFYSYKGGVGRTMALANAAYRLRAKGKRVFVLDFDLEAPGVDVFFNCADAGPGLVEYVDNYLEHGTVPDLEGFVHQVPPGHDSTDGAIFYMSAGSFDNDYQRRLARLNWKDFYAQNHGFLFVENLKGAIKENYSPDYVLIDSRTGLTDISGICTLQLPDVVVFLFALNRQNTEGVSKIFQSVVHNQLNRPIDTILVATPVPDVPDFVGLKEHRMAKATECLGREIDLVLPFAPFAALEETVLAPKSGTHLGEAYDKLTDLILALNKSDVVTLLKKVMAIRREGDPDRAETEYLKLIEGFPTSAEVWHSYGTFLRASRKPEEAADAFRRAIELKGSASNYAELAITLRTLGDSRGAEAYFFKFLQRSSQASQIWRYSQFFDSRNDVGPAIAGYKRYLEVCQKEASPGPMVNLGNVYMRIGDYKAAVECFRRARDLAPNLLPVVYNLGYALGLLGEKGESRFHFERAIEIYEHVHKTQLLPADNANRLQAIGQAYLTLGHLEKAESSLLAALDIGRTLTQRVFSSITYASVSPQEFCAQTESLLREVSDRKRIAAEKHTETTRN